jgi:hypothetical protein
MKSVATLRLNRIGDSQRRYRIPDEPTCAFCRTPEATEKVSLRFSQVASIEWYAVTGLPICRRCKARRRTEGRLRATFQILLIGLIIMLGMGFHVLPFVILATFTYVLVWWFTSVKATHAIDVWVDQCCVPE